MASVNNTQQLVISGEEEGVEKAIRLCVERGALMVKRLPIGWAIHTPLMERASQAFAQAIRKWKISTPRIPVLSYLTGEHLRTPKEIKEELSIQFCRPNHWHRVLLRMVEEGIHTFVEVGPGNVLTQMVRWVDRTAEERVTHGGGDYVNPELLLAFRIWGGVIGELPRSSGSGHRRVQGDRAGHFRAFGRMSAQVVINFGHDEETARQAERESRTGGKAIAWKTDITRKEEVDRMFKEVLDRFGRLDVLVNNAGVIRDTYMMLMSDKDWDRVIETNLKGTFYCCRTALRPMIAKRKGRIINMVSPSAITGRAGQTNYSASKGGVISLTKSLAREVAPFGILVNAVSPGIIQTEMIENLDDKVKNEFLGLIPMKRFGSPKEVASLVFSGLRRGLLHYRAGNMRGWGNGIKKLSAISSQLSARIKKEVLWLIADGRCRKLIAFFGKGS